MKAIPKTKLNFEQEVLQSRQPVLVDFYAAWCGPCQVLLPTVDALAEGFKGRASVVKVNVDEHPELAQRYGVVSIPTLLFFSQGEPVKRLQGVQARSTLATALEELL